MGTLASGSANIYLCSVLFGERMMDDLRFWLATPRVQALPYECGQVLEGCLTLSFSHLKFNLCNTEMGGYCENGLLATPPGVGLEVGGAVTCAIHTLALLTEIQYILLNRCSSFAVYLYDNFWRL